MFDYILFLTEDSRCKSDISGFLHYRALDLCYNFNPQHNIDYDGHIVTTCSSYGGELLRIDSQERQTYMEHILGRYLATTGTTIKNVYIEFAAHDTFLE
jgi:hypothetical protein